MWCHSSFTNVLVDLALMVGRQRLQDDTALKDHTCLNVEEVMELLIVLSFLGFQRSVHQKTFGTAKGYPVLVTMANLMMEDVEQRALSKTNAHPRFWKWYFDNNAFCVTSQ